MNFEKRRPKKDKGPEKRRPILTGEHILKAGMVALSIAAGVTAKDHLNRRGESRHAVYESIKDDKRLALPMFAMLARGYLSRPVQLLADPALRHIRSIDPAVVVPLTTRAADASFPDVYQTERAQYDANPDDHVQLDEKSSARSKRETLRDQKAAFSEAISKYKRDPIQLGQSVAMISRNISWNQFPIQYTFGTEDHGSNKPARAAAEVSQHQIKAEVAAVLKERQRLRETDPLAHSNIVLLSNNELSKSVPGKQFGSAALVTHLQYVAQTSSRADTHQFKKTDRLSAIKAPPVYSFSHITTHADASADSLRAAKKEALRAIANGSKKTSFLFDGHGSESGIYLSNGQVQNATYVHGESISVDEMADALGKRWFQQKRTDPHATTLNISIMLGSCTSQNFIRALAARLESLGIPQPQFMISSSEYGQFGFSDTRERYNSQFWKWVINNDTIGGMIEHKGDVKDQTPAIFTPRPERATKLMQLGGVVMPLPESSPGTLSA